jgi:hypothetical protein
MCPILEIDYKCHNCGQSFKTQSELLEHLMACLGRDSSKLLQQTA